MENLASIRDDLVFGLDIGTRNIVGVVGYQNHDKFNVVAMAQKEHETRAMLDGQIHDIYKVGDTIRAVRNQLEKQLGFQLKDVCIAAAGRVLKTLNATAEYEFEEETRVNQEHIYSLNMLAVESAHNQINTNASKVRFYCVGYTPVRYKLNEFDISNLEGHKANKIGVELIATFLPDEVVDGLYEAVEYAGLEVASLTLEPIAAMNVAIPEQYRLLNIGLIDVGAGTSDICLTKDGSIVAYGMIPYAGDEMTEIIAKHFLVDFNTAEKIKVDANCPDNEMIEFDDIMGLPQQIPASEIRQVTESALEGMAKKTSDKIIELNGGKPVNAVFVVGGGGKLSGYTDKIAECLGIPSQRVALRGKEVLTNVDFLVDDFEKDSLYVTPVGICTNYYTQKNNFVFVTVNKERIKLYDNNKLTIIDAVMQVGYPNDLLFPRRGKSLSFTVNGKTRMVRGSAGEGAVIMLNGKQANMHASIERNDVIQITESTIGVPASCSIGQLDEYHATIRFIVDGKNVLCPKFAYVNGELKSEFYDIKENDEIQMESYYTVAQLFEFLDLDITNRKILVNNVEADQNTKVYENFTITTSEASKDDLSFAALTLEEEMNAETEATSHQEAIESDQYDELEIDEIDTSKQEGHEMPIEDGQNADQIPAQATESSNTVHDIVILVNKEPVRLSGKKEYILVDLFLFYEFDLSKPKGNIVIKLNGQKVEYTAPLHDSDVVDLYWEANL